MSYETWTKLHQKYSPKLEEGNLVDHLNEDACYWDGVDTMIIHEVLLYRLLDEKNDNVTEWKQILVRVRQEQCEPIKDDICGLKAYIAEMKKIKSYYSHEEFEACLRAHEAEYDTNKKQVHSWIEVIPGVVNTFKNCYEYDINGAHNDALCEIFPKAAKMLRKQYDERHEHPDNKKLVNYFVGYLARAGYRKTYNWIVQRTTAMLNEAMNHCNGEIVYANTDGFIVWKPEQLIEPSKKLGQFKLEYHGDVRVYQGINYICFQYKDEDKVETKGSVLTAVRNMINLEKNDTVEYARVLRNNCYFAEDIKQIKCEEVIYD